MRTLQAVSLTAAVLGLMGCTKGPSVILEGESLEKSGMGVSQYNVNLNPVHKTVCDPFGGDPSQNPEKGLKASLYYLSPGVSPMNSASDYVTKATVSNQNLYFSDLVTKTRMFTEGFSTQSSSVVKDDLGNTLIEYFGLKFESNLRLRDSDPEGEYELASLADDGVIVRAKINGTWKTIVNNDGDHPTKMGCASELLQMTRETSIPIEVYYYQGPRMHISNVLMWKKSSPDILGKDARCGQMGNDFFFNPSNNSEEMNNYKDLLARGWAPIHADNYFLNSNTGTYNPCQEVEGPAISGLRIDEVLSRDVYVSWQTDLPATSQVLVTTASTGEQRLTDSDLVLRTSHSMRVSGLNPNTQYQVQAVSIGENLGKTLSAPIIITTSR